MNSKALRLPQSKITEENTSFKEKVLGYLIGPSGCLVVNAVLKFRISPLIKGAMKLTRSDFTTLAQRGMKLFHIDTNKFYKK